MPEHADNFDLSLTPEQRDAFFKIVQEKYNGDMRLALQRAIEYFLLHEQNRSLQTISETLRQIQHKISNIREMNSQITQSLRDTNSKLSQFNQNRDSQKDNGEK
jgi:methyl-accepting chemotaxis protein